MPSIHQNNRAALLLDQLQESDGLSLDRLALLIGVPTGDLRDCIDRKSALPWLVQVRLSRAIASRVPRLASRARRLEDQARAAMNMEGGQTALHLTAPARWW
jgi:hypothetical protein